MFHPAAAVYNFDLLIDELHNSLNTRSETEFYTEVGKQLSTLARKSPPWGWRYMKSVHSGTIQPGKKLLAAIDALGAVLDGIPPAVAVSKEITCFTAAQVKSGSIILSDSIICIRPGCLISFVPVVPWQKYHSKECRLSS